MDAEGVTALRSLLDQFTRRGRGIPQMLTPSDRLADAYLGVIDRRLTRDGHDLHRYADDTRVIAQGWDQANAIIEAAAEYARDLGLILSGHKTSIRLRTKVDHAERVSERFMDGYLEGAQADLTVVVATENGPYDTLILEEVPPEQFEAMQEAHWRVLQDWHSQIEADPEPPTFPPEMATNPSSAFAWAQLHPERLPRKLLLDMVFHDPLRLEDVCRYLIT